MPYLAQMVRVADFLDGVIDLYGQDDLQAAVDYGGVQHNALAWGYARCAELDAEKPSLRQAKVAEMVSSDFVYEVRLNVRLLVLAIENLCPQHTDLIGQ